MCLAGECAQIVVTACKAIVHDTFGVYVLMALAELHACTWFNACHGTVHVMYYIITLWYMYQPVVL